ncbi:MULTISPECIES: DUF4091 domain-containing protein [unclassified Bacteroides]|jgi:hypothetical protein|uniref:DUF4091 domain-containing protein n=1 Tax=unclassified Bacteroides TaxID=2646097 RepID=UPI000E9002A8|nr:MULTISPECIES: DUF4091 domain-containing protein [unclassified Bacteroides]RGN48675.1 DUF4091 domain-containing protein [Bacteroides sp. OM05-12]RHR75638.1 DUF4091 domain-containing protein [Bacteroides sp. AF16-49]
MKNILLSVLFFTGTISIYAQIADSYRELPNPVQTDLTQWDKVNTPKVSWGSTDVRYKKEVPPSVDIMKNLTLSAWKGERVCAQFVIWSSEEIKELNFSAGELRNGEESIGKEHLTTAFVRYVMTDELNKDGNGGCGQRPDPTKFDSTLVADPIDHITPSLLIPSHSTQGGWVSIHIPSQVKAGAYRGTILVKDGEKVISTLGITVNVGQRTLPPPSEWAFHLDLWQNPYAVARYYQVTPWSKEHFDYMRPHMKLYADAGGKSITASIMHKPWNGQTYDYFESMVTWIKKADGTWMFDYTVFDKWVEFMMEMGIRKQINCYSMVPWKLSFRYFDQATNSLQSVSTQPGEAVYEDMWLAMLRSFAAHLKQKGWFGITYISMDERPMETMLKTLEIIRKADKDFKVSLAGAYHKELVYELDDYCVALRMKYPEDVKRQRKQAGKVTTFYTSCEEARPNTFSFSPPAETEWFAWYSAKEGLDGYLRWALNSWVKHPLQDSRFHTWAAGDTYLIYPGGRSSLRFEHLIDGIQAYEKIRLLKKEYAEKGDKRKLDKIDKALQLFDETTLKEVPAAKAIGKAKRMLNNFE